MTEDEKALVERIELAADHVASRYRLRGDHDGDLIADAFDDFSNALFNMRVTD